MLIWRRSVSHELIASMPTDICLAHNLAILRLIRLLVSIWRLLLLIAVWRLLLLIAIWRLLLWIALMRHILLKTSCYWLSLSTRARLSIIGRSLIITYPLLLRSHLRVLAVWHWWTSLIIHLRVSWWCVIWIILCLVSLRLGIINLHLTIFVNENSLLSFIKFLIASKFIDIDFFLR